MSQYTGARRFHRKAPVLLTEINITPFVDVMLVLLIIFMVTTPMMLSGINIELPKEQVTALESREENVVSLRLGGAIFYNDKRLSETDLMNKLKSLAAGKPNASVYLRADKDLAYGDVVHVMGIINNSGIRQLGMITEVPQNMSNKRKK